MRIAYFTDTFLPQVNGVTHTLGKLDDYLDRNSVDHVFFAPEYPESYPESGMERIKRFKSISFPIYPECRLSVPLYAPLSKKVDAFKPDLIHLVTPLGIGRMGLKYAREKGIPIVSSFHTYFNAYLKYYKLEFLEDSIWSYFKWFHSFCGINFCPSTDTIKVLEEKGIRDLRIWARGIDAGKFNPDYRNDDLRSKFDAAGKLLFLYVGRVAAEKDLDVLLECMNNINALHPGKAVFVITGDGPYMGHMRQYSPDNVYFTGYLKGRELAEMYASSDVFIFPSSTETFGNVVLEAMASGLPVVTADAGGVKDSVMSGSDGFMCRAGSAVSFTKAMEAFVRNPEMAVSMGAKARQHAMGRTWDSIFDGLLSDCEDAVSAPGAGNRRTA